MESIKHIIKKLLGGWVVTIPHGPLKGFRWSASCGKKFIRGNYEPFKTDAFVRHVRQGDIVIDVGAHVGYYTAIASLLSGKEGRVFSFEPRPLNLGFLRKHIALNKLENIRVFELGISNYCGKGRFNIQTGTGTGRLDQWGGLEIEVVTLDDLLGKRDIRAPDFLKIDVEGEEMNVLHGAPNIIQSSRPKILVAVHSEEKLKSVKDFLEFRKYRLNILNPAPGKGDTEILALPQ